MLALLLTGCVGQPLQAFKVLENWTLGCSKIRGTAGGLGCSSYCMPSLAKYTVDQLAK